MLDDHRKGRSLNDVEITTIHGDASAFAAFAFPQRRAKLAALPKHWVAIGARWRGAPVGLVIARVADNRAWLESVMVAAPLRRKGVGSALLAALSDQARLAEAPRIATQYSSFLKDRLSFEALLASAGWQAPHLNDIQLVGNAGSMVEAIEPWRPLQRIRRNLGEYRIEPFALGPQDDAVIDALLAAEPDLGVPDPRREAALDPEVSITIRHRGALVGWLSAERLIHSRGHGTLVPGVTNILYTGARLADGHPRLLIIVAYREGFQQQATRHGPASRAVFRTHPGATAMYQFTRARYEPIAIHVEERWGSTLQIAPDTVDPAISQESLAC